MQTWIIGNWKQNPASLAEVNNLSTNLAMNINNSVSPQANYEDGNLMVMPSNVHLIPVINSMRNTGILVGCQDISEKSATVGAYTGDCSAQQMVETGVTWTLVGHSERRHYHCESSEVLITKIKNAFEQGLGVVYCIGETLEIREQGKTIEVLQEQLAILEVFADRAHVPSLDEHVDNIIIAYEPVWAIGTGEIPTVEEVEFVNQKIRDYLTQINESLASTPILYGGSVNADNAELFAHSPSINGALIGGASLKADNFLNIADVFFKIKSKA